MREKINEKNIPAGARKKLPFWSRFAWTSRNISQTINILLISYITFYSTDVLELNVGIVSMILVVSKIIDALTDLGAGYLIDSTHTKLGKARPYEIFIILQWFFTILMFAVPDVSPTMQYLYIFIMYVVVNAVCITMLGAADSVYLSRAYTTEENRTKVLSFTGIFIMIVSTIFSALIPQFMGSAAGATESGWIKMTVMLGVPLAIIGILRFIFVKEIVADVPETNEKESTANGESTSKITLKEMIRLLLKNKFALIVIGLTLCGQIIQNMGSANTYYFKYIAQNMNLYSIVGMFTLVTPFVLLFFPLLSRKFGTTKLLQVSMALGILGYAVRLLGGVNSVTILAGSLIAAIAIIPLSVMINAYLIDCMDYGEWINGKRIEGGIASINNFASKLGGAVGTGLIGLIMGAAGYDGNLAVQSDMANMAIVGVFNVLPLIIYIIMLVLSLAYKMDAVRPQMLTDLKKKHDQMNHKTTEEK